LDHADAAFGSVVVRRYSPVGGEAQSFELFEAGHGGIDYRYPLALAWLAERLAR
jgi:hypothetical protein